MPTKFNPPAKAIGCPAEFEKTIFAKPFNSNWKMKAYLKLLIANLDGGTAKREEVFQQAGIDIDGKCPEGYLSNYFSAFNASKIIVYDPAHRVWVQGENYWKFMGYVFQLMSRHPILKDKMGNMLRKWKSTSINFIMEVDSEQS